MLAHTVQLIFERIAFFIECFGVVAILTGGIFASTRYFQAFRKSHPDAYTEYRSGLGKAILLGLEFFVAADIIRTVTLHPTFEALGILAIVVLIRTFLSFSLEIEISGRLPWREKPKQ